MTDSNKHLIVTDATPPSNTDMPFEFIGGTFAVEVRKYTTTPEFDEAISWLTNALLAAHYAFEDAETGISIEARARFMNTLQRKLIEQKIEGDLKCSM